MNAPDRPVLGPWSRGRSLEVAEAREDAVLASAPSCAGTGPEVWFSDDPDEIAVCQRVCAGCPVQAMCLAGAIARDEQAGVWGGRLFTRRMAEVRLTRLRTGKWEVRAKDGSRSLFFRWLPDTAAMIAHVAPALAESAVRVRARDYVRNCGHRLWRGSLWAGPWDQAGVTGAVRFLTGVLDDGLAAETAAMTAQLTRLAAAQDALSEVAA